MFQNDQSTRRQVFSCDYQNAVRVRAHPENTPDRQEMMIKMLEFLDRTLNLVLEQDSNQNKINKPSPGA